MLLRKQQLSTRRLPDERHRWRRVHDTIRGARPRSGRVERHDQAWAHRAPIIIAICGVIWGVNGAFSSAYAVAIVLLNFALAAALIAGAARISVGLMMGATMFGYLIRLALIFLAVWIVKDASWISLPALGSTIIVTHLGLLFWEMKYVALSLSQPGLKSDVPQVSRDHTI